GAGSVGGRLRMLGIALAGGVIALWTGLHLGRDEVAAIGKPDDDFVGAVHGVAVRQNDPRRSNDDTGPLRLLGWNEHPTSPARCLELTEELLEPRIVAEGRRNQVLEVFLGHAELRLPADRSS